VQLGSCAVGIRTAEGVVLAVEKRQTSPLLEQSSLEKVYEVDRHVGVAVSGLVADARTLVDHARVECANHRFTYDEPLRVASLTQAVCDLKMAFGEGGEEDEDEGDEGGGGSSAKKARMSRPFGVSLLIAGVDAKGPVLFHTDPSGTFLRYEAHAIGAGAEGAVAMLAEKYAPGLTLAAARALAVRVLGDTMEEKLTATNFELATVTPDKGFALAAAAELAPLVERALAEAAAEGGAA